MYKQVNLCTIMTSFAAFYMQDSGKYSIYTEASGRFAVAGIYKRFVCKSYTDSDIVKMEKQTTLSV